MDQGGLETNTDRIIRDDDKEVPGYPTPPGLPRILVKGVQEKKLSVSALGHLVALALFLGTPYLYSNLVLKIKVNHTHKEIYSYKKFITNRCCLVLAMQLYSRQSTINIFHL